MRLARVNDAPAVGLVQAASWRAGYAGILDPEVIDAFEPQLFGRAWRSALTTPPSTRHRLLVACQGATVIGFAAVGPSADPDARPGTAEILAAGIAPEARRTGHGSRLLNACVDTARGAGHDELVVWLPDGDTQTRDFLTTAGFAPDGAHRERVVTPDGAPVERTSREVRLRTALLDPATTA